MRKRHEIWARAVVVAVVAAGIATTVGGGGSAGAARTAFGTGDLALPDVGVLHLRLGATDQFAFVPADPSEATSTQSVSATTGGGKKCQLLLGTVAGSATLVDVAATNSAGTSNLSPGFDAESIGVRSSGSNASGTPCGIVDSTERLVITAAGALAGYEFDRAELDVEVRSNAVVRATVSFAGAEVGSYTLRTGSSVPAGAATSATGRNDFSCRPSADSGNNSGPDDNCRWLIDPPQPFDTIAFVALQGEFGLMGGSDQTPICTGSACDGGAGTSLAQAHGGTAATLFHVTDISGVLDCGEDTVTEGGGADATISGVRLTNADADEACIQIPYSLGADGDEVSFLKDLGTQTSAQFVFDVQWPVIEGFTRPFELDPTFHTFDGDPAELVLDVCQGTPVFDAAGEFAGFAEILQGGPPPWTDLDPSLPGVQHACWLTQDLRYVGDDAVQLSHSIYVYGDWVSFR